MRPKDEKCSAHFFCVCVWGGGGFSNNEWYMASLKVVAAP